VADGPSSPDTPDRVADGARGRRRRERPVGIAIVGPTASGKTALSIEVARRLDGEIVSMDSRQVYRQMDIGTAKASAAERGAVPHHGLDLVEPDRRYSAGRFARDARGWIDDIRARGRVPIMVGGTGFFLRALTEPLFREPALPARARSDLEAYLADVPDKEQLRWLRRLDPQGAERLGRGGGSQRRKRALEVALLTGRPLGWWHEHAPAGEPAVPLLVFVVRIPREEMDRRIDQRVGRMLEQGLVQEVQSLLARGYDRDDPGMSGVGYREVIDHLRGDCTFEEAADRIRRATRQYARRQLTWNRNQLPHAIELDGTRPAQELAAIVAEEWRRGSQAAQAQQ